ncbi:spermidine/putrescine ABC transporter permease PotB [Limisalsivibrio acetivorans]|uniref:spermidine/putrescine ABC transporter permease PotB n=1 Tax=Limisalsivibrio acetivorans TaxID=1304888 RepID=UPI0003B5F9FC|nr:spermidine/putrescine ABC transporter permease PotB [Limisalsivibrio acetivorans]
MNESSFFRNTVIAVISIWLVVFVFLPNVMVIATSFLTRSETDFVQFTFSLESYSRIFTSLYFKIFSNSFKLAAVSTAVCLIAGYPFAYFMARSPKEYRSTLLFLIIIPFWTSSLIRTYAIMIILKTNGIINTLLEKIGLIDEPVQFLYTQGAVVLGMAYSLLPFMILPLYATIEKLDKRYIEAAEDLGASRIQTFTKIILPLTMPGIIAGCMLVFLPAMGLFYIPDLLGGAKNILLGNLIKNQFLTARDWPFGSAASVVMTGVMAVLLLAYYKSMKKLNRSLM